MMIIHNVMMRVRLWPMCAVALIFLLPLSSFPHNSDNSQLEFNKVYNNLEELENKILFNLDAGETFTEALELNGTILNKQGNYSWKIHDLFDLDVDGNPTEVTSGQYLDSISPINDNTWEWSLSVNISEINCTCNLVISSTNVYQEFIHSSDILVYLGTEHHRPYILTQTLNSGKINEFNYSISFELILPNQQTVDIDGLNEENIFLDTKFCQIRSNICVDNWIMAELNFSIMDDIVTVHIVNSELGVEDGFWMFEIFVKDNFLRNSNIISQILIIDNNPPIVQLSSSNSISESESVLVYAQVDDYFSGSPISLTWTITDPSGSSRGLFEHEFYHNSTIQLTLNNSGFWDVNLLVRDSANFLVRENLSIFVENINPQVVLDLDGLSIGQGDEIILTSGSSWILNASGSTDSPNDIDDITFEWFIDGQKIDSKNPELTNLDIEIDSKTDILLVIYDDDQFSDNISFSISISQNEDENISFAVILFSGVSIFFVVILLVFKIFVSRGSNSFELPKWKSKN